MHACLGGDSMTFSLPTAVMLVKLVGLWPELARLLDNDELGTELALARVEKILTTGFCETTLLLIVIEDHWHVLPGVIVQRQEVDLRNLRPENLKQGFVRNPVGIVLHLNRLDIMRVQ